MADRSGPLLVSCLGAALALHVLPAASQTPATPGQFLIQPFGSIPMAITSLDVAANGDIVLGALPPDGPHADSGIRVARFDADGRRLWERNPAPRAEFATTVVARALDGGGTLVLHDETPKDLPQLALIRLDAGGQQAWRRGLGPGGAFDLLAERDGSAFVAGSVVREKTGEIDALVMRVSAEGLPVWRRRFSGDNKEGANSAEFLRSGGQGVPVVAGLADIVHDADDLPIASRGMAMRLRADGQIAWRHFLGDGTALTVVAGMAAGPVGDAYILTVSETAASAGVQFIELLRLRADGSIAWQRPLAGPANQEFNDMAALPGGGLALAGSEPLDEDTDAAVLVLLDAEGIERARINYRGYKMRRALMVKPHPAGGMVVLFEGPAGAGLDLTGYLARVDATGRF